MLSDDTQELYHIFTLCGLSRLGAYNLLSWMKNHTKNRGIQSLINVLKEQRSNILKRIPSKIGCLKNISVRALKSRRNLTMFLRIVGVYKRWEAPSPTQKDYDKEVHRIRSYKPGPRPSVETIFTFQDYVTAENLASDRQSVVHLPRDSTRDPIFKLPRGSLDISSLAAHFPLLFPHTYSRHSDLFCRYRMTVLRLRAVHPLSDDELMTSVIRLHNRIKVPSLVETIGTVVLLTKDGGYKRRLIANPSIVLQMVLEPLQRVFDEFLQTLPESSVHDQASGVLWGVEQLSQGKVLHSVDLSSATDTFPFDYTMEVCSELFPSMKRDLALWYDISRSFWKDPFGGLFRWTKGQPMGLAPSFAGFTISHIFLLRSLGGTSSNFRVIGDDVIISDNQLADRYKQVLSSWSVPISVSKTISSETVGEFAGRIFDRHGVLPVYKSTKILRNLTRDPFGALRQYGWKGLKLLPRKIRSLIQDVASYEGILNQENLSSNLRSLAPDLAHLLFWENPVVELESGRLRRPLIGVPDLIDERLAVLFKEEYKKDVLNILWETDSRKRSVSLDSSIAEIPQLISSHISSVARSGDHLSPSLSKATESQGLISKKWLKYSLPDVLKPLRKVTGMKMSYSDRKLPISAVRKLHKLLTSWSE